MPANQSRKLLPPSTSMLSLYSSFKHLKEGLVDDENDGESAGDQSIMETDTPTTVIRSSKSKDFGQIFDDSSQHTSSHESRSAFIVPPWDPSVHHSCSRLDLQLPKFSATTIQNHSQTAESLTAPWKTYSKRPLPDIPVYIPTREFSLQHSRNSSVTSRTASITASLKSYVDRRASASPEPPEIGVATVGKVVVLSPGTTSPTHMTYSQKKSMLIDTDRSSGDIMVLNQNELTKIGRRLSNSPQNVTAPRHLLDTSISGVPENLPLPLLPVSCQNRLGTAHPHVATPPSKNVISMANITIRKNRGYTISPAKTVYTPTSKRLPTPSFDSPVDDSQASFDNETTLSLTESQWMCRTPSPIKNGNQAQVNKLWSPGIDSDRRWRVGDAIPSAAERDGGSGLRKKALDWYGRSARVDSSVLSTTDGDEEVFTEQSKKLEIRTWI